MRHSFLLKILCYIAAFGWVIPCLMGMSLYVQHFLTPTSTEADQWVKVLAKLAAHGLFIISGTWLVAVAIVFVVMRLLSAARSKHSSLT